MEALLYFVFWAGLISLMMRFGCGAHVMGHGRHGGAEGRSQTDAHGRQALRWVPPARDVDPVCGRTVDTGKAKPSVYDGDVFYFCSRECREAFEARPALYLDKAKALEGSHAKDSLNI